MYTVTWWLCCRLQAPLYRVCSSSLSIPGWEQSSCNVWHSWCTHVIACALPPLQLWHQQLQKPLGTTCSGMDISQIRYSHVYLHIRTIEVKEYLLSVTIFVGGQGGWLLEICIKNSYGTPLQKFHIIQEPTVEISMPYGEFVVVMLSCFML